MSLNQDAAAALHRPGGVEASQDLRAPLDSLVRINGAWERMDNLEAASRTLRLGQPHRLLREEQGGNVAASHAAGRGPRAR